MKNSGRKGGSGPVLLVVVAILIGAIVISLYAYEYRPTQNNSTTTSTISATSSTPAPSITPSTSITSATSATSITSTGCGSTSTGLIPLTDLGPRTYEGYEGGLYPAGTNTMPKSHLDDGVALANLVTPLDSLGNPSPAGRVVFLTIGMSNNVLISNAFIQLAQKNTSIDPALVIVNGAEGGMTASNIASVTSSAGSSYWNSWVEQQLKSRGADDLQVQAAWLYDADAGPRGSDIAYAATLSSEFVSILHIMHDRFANLKLVYLYSREYAGYATTTLNPEPYSYASGFSVKWTIQAQLNGSASLNYNATKGAVQAPWVAWAAYTWADGLKPRSDGLTYSCSDFGSDGTHPSTAGAQKIAGLLYGFFASSPTSKTWFLK